MNKTRTVCITTIALVFLTASVGLVSATAYTGYNQNVTIRFQRNGVPMSGAVAEVYQLENGWPARLVGKLQSGHAGTAAISLSTGEYCVEAYMRGEPGYHGYTNFSVDMNNLYAVSRAVDVELQPDENKNNRVDLTPNIATMKPDRQNVTLVPAISAVKGKEGNEEVPIYVDNRVLSNTNKLTPVNLAQLDPATRAILEELEQKIRSQNSTKGSTLGSGTHSGTIGTQSVGDIIWLNGWQYAVVEEESYSTLWHPMVLIDSASYLTHTFSLSAFYGKSIEITSGITCAGVAVSGTYESAVTYSATWGPVTTSGGEVKTWESQFDHTYQSGDVYTWVYPVWVYTGAFQREYVSAWNIFSGHSQPYAMYSETRATWLVDWNYPVDVTIGISSSSEYTGSLGFSVSRGDIFGSATISVSFRYGVETAHHLMYSPPSSKYHVVLYAGNAFDINVRAWTERGYS